MENKDTAADGIAERRILDGGIADDGAVVDEPLFKAIGLYQLLHPAEGTRQRWYRTVYLCVLWLTFGLQCVQIVGLYFTLHDFRRFAYMTVLAVNGMMCVLKGYVLVTNADRLQAVLDVARYGFTTSGLRDPGALRRCRATLSKLLRTFVTISFSTLTVWTVTPLFMDSHVPIAQPDGTIGYYRTTIDNLWLPGMSVSLYNSTPVWATIYLMEVYICFVNVISWSLFDCYMVTTCFVLNAQFRTIAAGYETLGRSYHRRRPPSPPHPPDIYVNNEDSNLDFYDDLIVHIKDNQNIIKKFDDFIEVVRPVVLSQIASSSNSVVGLIFLIALLYVMGWSIVSAPVLKFISGLASLGIELYIYCYGFNHIEIAKSTVNFGLYSSNWTMMDLKFKKTLLLAMNMNSSHMRVMKVSPKSIINLEMFARVMNMSYSIVSVLLNSSAEKKAEI